VTALLLTCDPILALCVLCVFVCVSLSVFVCGLLCVGVGGWIVVGVFVLFFNSSKYRASLAGAFVL
jgi:hypothetical protein